MISFANAKINLGLLITEKRSDGYHNIETVFYPVKLYDVVEINEASTFEFQVQGVDIPNDGSNLCERAYRLLNEKYPLKPVSIQLLKNIPVGAGLGGGSSDAAYVLKMLNQQNELGLSDSELEEFAVQLGADCPFFIQNKPVFASGIGASFEDFELNLSEYYIVLINPGIHISTKEAYESITPQTPQVDLRSALRLPIQEWKFHVINDFELGVFRKYPKIEQVKHTLYERGALFAAMSGSGSSVFGIFEKEIDLSDLKELGQVYYPVDID